MIEFKRTGDVMIFDCPAFRIEVVNGSEKITLSDSEANRIIQIRDAFKVLDMMLEHKSARTPVYKDDLDINESVKSEIKKRLSDSNNLRCVVGD
jgi:hypothetical protein